MTLNLSFLIAFGCIFVAVNAAAIDNSVYTEDEPRINNSNELLSTIIDKCFNNDAMHCLKVKVLNYLDTINGLNTKNSRAFQEENIDDVILDRTVRALNTHEFKVQLPQTIFHNTLVTYRADRGIDFELPQEEARGDMKKKLLLPVLLLLKLKMKVIMPIILSLIGLKAMKALILSKIAIKLVLGFIIYNLVQKLGGMKMSMMPAPEPMAAYGVPPTTPASTYDPSSWEPSSGGPYSRVWDSSNAGSAQSMAYSSYYPSRSASVSSANSESSSSPSSSSSYSSYTS